TPRQPSVGSALQHRIPNPFSQPRWKFQSCDRLRYIAGSAAVGAGNGRRFAAVLTRNYGAGFQ
ncbi:TPA: hypothetical protein ACGCF7_004173, partial [Stenotrophomonas maltophilia]